MTILRKRVYTLDAFREKTMKRTVFVLVSALYASGVFAEEEIYLYTSYNNNEGNRISHKMKCRDSNCVVERSTAKQSVALSREQRNQILEAFQAEVKRFDIKSAPESGDHLVKIKFRYSANGKRLDLTQRLPAAKLSDISPQLTAVVETYFAGLDLSSLGSPEPTKSDKKSDAPSKAQ